MFPYLATKLSNFFATYTKINDNNIDVFKNDINNAISEKLKICGLNSAMSSFWSLRFAIYKCCFSDNKKFSLSKDIYPEIALKYHSTTAAIECAIRNSIKLNYDTIFSFISEHRSDKLPNSKITSKKLIEILTEIICKEKSETIDLINKYKSIKNDDNYVIE